MPYWRLLIRSMCGSTRCTTSLGRVGAHVSAGASRCEMEITSCQVHELRIRHEGMGVITKAAEVLPLHEGIVSPLGTETGTGERADRELHRPAVVEVAVVVEVQLRRDHIVKLVAHVWADHDGGPFVAVAERGVVHDVAAERDVLR